MSALYIEVPKGFRHGEEDSAGRPRALQSAQGVCGARHQCQPCKDRLGIRKISSLDERCCSGTAAQGRGKSPSLGVSESCGDVALRDVVGGHGLAWQGLGYCFHGSVSPSIPPHRLQTGWSVHTFQTEKQRKMQALSPQELEVILEVIRKAEKLDVVEQQRIGYVCLFLPYGSSADGGAALPVPELSLQPFEHPCSSFSPLRVARSEATNTGKDGRWPPMPSWSLGACYGCSL